MCFPRPTIYLVSHLYLEFRACCSLLKYPSQIDWWINTQSSAPRPNISFREMILDMMCIMVMAWRFGDKQSSLIGYGNLALYHWSAPLFDHLENMGQKSLIYRIYLGLREIMSVRDSPPQHNKHPLHKNSCFWLTF